MFTLTWGQVDWNGGFVRLEPGTTRNQEGRAFPITPALRAILERRQELTRRCERAQPRIIPLVFHRSGRPILSFRRSWKKAGEEAAGLASSSTIFGVARYGIWSAPAWRDPSR